MKDKKMLFGIVLVFVFLLSMGLTYAYFTVTTNIEGEPNDILTSTGTMEISYSDGPEILSEDIEPGWTVTKTVSVENTGSLDMFYAITWASFYNDIENDELVMSATCEETYYDEEYTGTCEGLDITPVTAGNIIEEIYIEPGDTHEYTFAFTFLEKNSAQNYNQGKRFSGVLNVIESDNMPNLYVQLLNSLNAPIVGATVETHSEVKSAVTDENGYAIIPNVEPGDHELVIKDLSNNTLDTRTITVQNGDVSTIVGNTLTSYKFGRDKSITIKMNGSNEINTIEDLVVAPEGCFQINGYSNYEIANYYETINNDPSEMMCPKECIIPSSINGTTITSIRYNAFENNQLTSVTIPNSVTSIGYNAFAHNQLTSVTIPESVTSIGEYAFSSNQLTNVIIPGSVTSIGGGAFENNQLTSVTIPENVTSIRDGAFTNNRLTNVIILNSSVNFGCEPFNNNPLTYITIDGVQTIVEFNACGWAV